MDIPIIVQDTEGCKEKELEDMKNALRKAKEEYKIEGVITGALYSQYQRERIEKVCDELGLTIFAPLWHKNQESALREMIHHGFKFIMTKIAGWGMDKSWLGKVITTEDIDRLVALNKKHGINVAGEGGEYESLVLDAPIFNKKIAIKESDIVMEKDYIGELRINNADLE